MQRSKYRVSILSRAPWVQLLSDDFHLEHEASSYVPVDLNKSFLDKDRIPRVCSELVGQLATLRLRIRVRENSKDFLLVTRGDFVHGAFYSFYYHGSAPNIPLFSSLNFVRLHGQKCS